MKHWTLAALGVVAIVVIVFGGCGSKTTCGSSPTAPGCPQPPAPTLSLTASTDLLKVLGTFTFAGSAVHHDGTPTVPIGQWSSDNTQVATVDAASGKVTAVAYGQATIIGEHDGVRAGATKLMAVVSDFQGTWSGDYAIVGCHETGDFQGEGFCTVFAPGTTHPIAASLTQPTNKADGTVYFGQMPATVTGTADAGGSLTFPETTMKDDPVSIKVTGMVFRMDGSSHLTGTFTTTWTATGAAGECGFDGQLAAVTRVSATPMAFSVRRPFARTWQDVAAAMRRR